MNDLDLVRKLTAALETAQDALSVVVDCYPELVEDSDLEIVADALELGRKAIAL